MENKKQEIALAEFPGCFLTYATMESSKIFVITYVFVDPKFRGQGVGKKLTEQGVLLAAKMGYQLGATCSYAKSCILRNEEWKNNWVNVVQ
ncbi:MAG: putative GNAT family acetyltransferase [Sphingobacteriales bacterium]|jgi:predicted GNAT family acetyltransferase